MDLLRGRPRQLWLLVGALAVLVAIALVLMARHSTGSDHGAQLARYGLAQREARDKAGKVESEAGQRKGGESFGREEDQGEAKHEDEGEDRSTREGAGVVEGRKGGEGERHGARTPWGEQVANRAFPRAYVDDRRALLGRRAFDRAPRAAGRSAVGGARAFEPARAAAPGHWTLLGPVTPNVSGEASQFFDP